MTNAHTATLSQSRNDLHWSFYDVKDGFIRWFGYNDAYWWDHVSETDQARTRIGKTTGRIFTIDFANGEVVVEGDE